MPEFESAVREIVDEVKDVGDVHYLELHPTHAVLGYYSDVYYPNNETDSSVYRLQTERRIGLLDGLKCMTIRRRGLNGYLTFYHYLFRKPEPPYDVFIRLATLYESVILKSERLMEELYMFTRRLNNTNLKNLPCFWFRPLFWKKTVVKRCSRGPNAKYFREYRPGTYDPRIGWEEPAFQLDYDNAWMIPYALNGEFGLGIGSYSYIPLLFRKEGSPWYYKIPQIAKLNTSTALNKIVIC